MKKIKNLLILTILAGIFLLTSCASDKGEAVELSKLKDGKSYCYQGLQWGMTEEEVEKALSTELETSESGTPDWLAAKKRCSLLGEKDGLMVFRIYPEEYGGRELEEMVFRFQADQEFFEKVYKELTDLYGKENRSHESGETISTFTWDGEETDGWITRMQLNNRKEDGLVEIHMGKFETNPQ